MSLCTPMDSSWMLTFQRSVLLRIILKYGQEPVVPLMPNMVERPVRYRWSPSSSSSSSTVLHLDASGADEGQFEVLFI